MFFPPSSTALKPTKMSQFRITLNKVWTIEKYSSILSQGEFPFENMLQIAPLGNSFWRISHKVRKENA